MNARTFAGLAAAVALVAAVGLGAAYGGVGPSTVLGADDRTTDGDTATPAGADSTPDAERPRFDYDDTFRLEATDDQAVRGTTGLEAGTELTVRLKSTGESPFLYQQSVTTDEDGAFEARFDLSDVGSNGTFNATLSHDGETIHNETGRVVATDTGEEDPETTQQRSDDSDGDVTARIRTDDGVVRLEAADDQLVRGTTDLEAGTELAVRLRSTGESPFLMQRTTTVEGDNTFAASFNLTSVAENSSFEAVVRADGDTVAEAPGEVDG